jgi:transposase
MVLAGRKEPTLGKTKPPYPPEVKAEVVRLVRELGASKREAARTVGCTVDSVTDWVQKSMRDDGALKDGGLTTDERAELNSLRRRVRILEQEKEILKKAAAWFAKETHSIP